MLAAVIFCRGCSWRCSYCHNAALRDPAGRDSEDFDAILAWLETRQGLLDAVVFSGGEPTLQPALGPAMAAVRAMGFRLGLHTAGIYPKALAAVLPDCDWVGLDIKAPRAAYDRVTGSHGSDKPAFASLALLRQSGVALEIRTTWHPALMNATELAVLAGELAREGMKDWVLQPFRPKGCVDAGLCATGPAVFPLDILEGLERAAMGLTVIVRG